MTSPFRIRRAQPVDDLAERLSLRRAIPLVAVETGGLAILLVLYAALHAQQSVLAPLLVPPAVSFVLVVANPTAASARPVRIVVSYLIAGSFGLGLALVGGPALLDALVAGSLTLLFMHLVGALHSPAIAIAMIAALAEFSPADAARALPLLSALAVLVAVLAWAVHRVMADATYPDRLW